MADTKDTNGKATRSKDDSWVAAALKGMPQLETWVKTHKVKGADQQLFERTSVPVSANVDPELGFAVVTAARGPSDSQMKDGSLQYNAWSATVINGLHTAYSMYLPEGYVFTAPSIGSRDGSSVSAKLAEQTLVLSEFEQSMLALVQAGTIPLDAITPDSVRQRVAALMAA